MSKNDQQMQNFVLWCAVIGAGLLFKWAWTRLSQGLHLTSNNPITLVAGTLGVMAGIFFVIALAQAGWWLWSYYRSGRFVRYIRVLPHSDTHANVKNVTNLVHEFYNRKRAWWQRLLRGREWFRFLIHHAEDNMISFYVGYPWDIKGVKDIIKDAFPGCEIYDISHDQLPLPQREQEGHGGRFFMNTRGKVAGLPLQPFEESQLGNILTKMRPNTWIDIRFSPASHRKLKRRVDQGLKNLNITKEDLMNIFKMEINFPDKPSKMDPHEKARYKSLYNQHTGREKPFDVALTVWSSSAGVVQNVRDTIETVMEFDNRVYMRRILLFKKWRNPVQRLNPVPLYTMLWTHEELANLVHLPDGNSVIYDEPKQGERGMVEQLRPGQSILPDNVLNEGITVGYLYHPLVEARPVKIPHEQFVKQVFVSGKTGSGKTALVLMCVQCLIDEWLEDPDNAPGFTFIDPKRDAVANILTRLRKARLEGKKVPWEKVHYFNLADGMLGLNLLHKAPGVSIDEIAENAVHVIMNAFQSGNDANLEDDAQTPQLNRMLRLAILTLLHDEKEHTILSIKPLLLNEEFRGEVLANIKDQFLRDEWADFEKEFSEKDVKSLSNRLQRFTYSSVMRRMFQTRLGINAKEYMDKGHIVLFDLQGFSDSNIRITMGNILMQYHQAAASRQSPSKIHPIFCDEGHQVQLPIIPVMQVKDRSAGVVLVMMTQFLDQFNKKMRGSIEDNCGTLICCTEGKNSAKQLAEISGGLLDAEQLQRLPSLVAAVKTEFNGEQGTFMVQSDPPYIYLPNGEPAKHKDDKEYNMAKEWGLSRGRKLQLRDYLATNQDKKASKNDNVVGEMREKDLAPDDDKVALEVAVTVEDLTKDTDKQPAIVEEMPEL